MARLTDNLQVETTVGRQGIVVDVDVKNKAAGLLRVDHDNTMDGDGTPDRPLGVNTDVIATKEDLAKFAKFSIEVVDELPEVGRDNVIYFVPKDGAAPDVHDEYVWTNGVFELIGSTQVDLTGYVKNTDIATYNNAGLVKQLPQSGIVVQSDGGLIIASASPEQVSAKASHYLPIVPSRLDYAVKVGLTTNTIALTDEEKAAAQEWLGVDTIVGDISAALDTINGEVL